MEKIASAKKIEFKQNNNEGLVIVEPLYPGYGNTIGNSLRRILLSSLSGSAVVGVKIKGAKHEFMALPSIKEDVIDIILKLKQLKLKILTETDEILKLELNTQGKKQVTAKDIKKNSQIEISNPDLVLATITDSTGSLSMDIYVANGRGYSVAEKNQKEAKEIDFIEIDSIFSPVLGVSYRVENVRVGKMTNWDKLILEIKTDGTVLIEDAFNQAVSILIEQFNSIVSLSNKKNIKKDSIDENIDTFENKEDDSTSVKPKKTTRVKKIKE